MPKYFYNAYTFKILSFLFRYKDNDGWVQKAGSILDLVPGWPNNRDHFTLFINKCRKDLEQSTAADLINSGQLFKNETWVVWSLSDGTKNLW